MFRKSIIIVLVIGGLAGLFITRQSNAPKQAEAECFPEGTVAGYYTYLITPISPRTADPYMSDNDNFSPVLRYVITETHYGNGETVYVGVLTLNDALFGEVAIFFDTISGQTQIIAFTLQPLPIVPNYVVTALDPTQYGGGYG